MAAKYTDQENILFSQIAYRNINDRYELYKGSYPDGKVPLSKVLSAGDKATLRSYGMTDAQMNSWKIAGVHDTNDRNGFAACIIDTGNGNAAVAFRGSEGMLDHDNAVHDWANADFGLLDKVQTRQHAETDRFLERYRDTLNQYDSLTMTGHSLGGNLAEYATITSDRHGLDRKIAECKSLDGPGFNKEFLAEHSDQIARMQSKMTHYRWSLVGNCLTDPSGTDITGKVKDGDRKDIFGRHDMKSLDLDKSGNIQKDTGYDPFSGGIVNTVTTNLDKLPMPLKRVLGFTTRVFFVVGVDAILGIRKTVEKVKQAYGKIKDAITSFFRGGSEGGHSGGGHGGGGGRAGGRSGSGDRLLVSTEDMRRTLNRYRQCQQQLADAMKKMDNAYAHLNRVWDGATKAAFMTKWIVLTGNIKKTESAMTRSINGLSRSIGLFEEAEDQETGRAENLDPGTVPPLF